MFFVGVGVENSQYFSGEKEDMTDCWQPTVIEQKLRKSNYDIIKSQSQCVFICLLCEKCISDGGERTFRSQPHIPRQEKESL